MNSSIPHSNLSDAPLLSDNRNDSVMKKFSGRLTDAYKEYGYLLIAFLIPAVFVYLLYLARGLYPFGDGSVLVLDLNGQYISFYEALHDILNGDADLFYSFSRNLGGEFLGIYDYYVASPFALLLGLFPESMLLEALLLLFMLKAGLCGLFMGFYLHKHAADKPNRLIVVMFSIMYALSSYCIIQQHNSMWIDAVMFLPLLALGIESLIRYGKFRLYVFSLAVTVWSNFYIGYMVVIFVVVYCFYDYFAHNSNNENNPLKENHHFARTFGRVMAWSVLALGMAALVILSARYSLSFGKSDFTSPSWEIARKIDLFEFFQKFLPCSYDTVRPTGRPIVYCGILTVMLVPAYFMSKKFSMREKLASALIVLFFIASFAVSVLDLIWHGFQKPNWLNYRYSFMLCFILLVLAYRAFEQIEFLSKKALLFSTALIGLYVLALPNLGDAVIIPDQKTATIRPFAMVWLSVACLLIYFIVICYYGKLRDRGRETAAMALVLVVCVELFLSGMADMDEFGDDVGYAKRSRYTNTMETFRPVAYTLQDYDKGFYRTEKTYERKTNDYFALQMKGLSLSTSTLHSETIDFLHYMGYNSKSHNSHYYYDNASAGGTMVNDSLLGIKYLITNDAYIDANQDLNDYYGDPIFEQEDFNYPDDFAYPLGEYTVYENPYALSLIYGVADAWEDFDPSEYYSPFDYINAMVTAMLGEDETVEIFAPTVQNGNPTLNKVDKSNSKDEWRYKIADSGTGDPTLTYKYTVPVGTELYFYYPQNPSTSRREVEVKISNGSKVVYNGQNIVSLGTSEQENIDLVVKLTDANKTLYVKQPVNGKPACYVYTLNREVFENAMQRLAAMNLTIDEEYTDSHLFGSVTTVSESQLMFTSIPYDAGWNIYVDGERVETLKSADALVSFRIDGAGEHRVELRYMPTTVALGLTSTVICTVFFVALLCLYPLLKRVRVFRTVVLVEGTELPPASPPERTAKIVRGDIGYVNESKAKKQQKTNTPSPAKGKPTNNRHSNNKKRK